ncbi:MAG: heme exporter protein CcmB [Chloroflexi bacterium]|nr:heme exporter protein CcmB [Chloroflexota bacterium]
MKTRFGTAVLAIVSKDLRAEIRSRDLLSVMIIFAFLCILVFSFALELDRVAREEAISGVLWVTLVFASLLGFNRSLAQEGDQGNLDAMLLAPVSRPAIFLGKLLSNYLFTLIVALVILPLMTVIYNSNLLKGWLIVTTVVGVLGFSSIGTLLAMLTLHTRSREALLPIAMLPVALPLLLTALRASTNILHDAPAREWLVWLQLLAAVTVIYLALCWLLSGFVLEE